MPGRKRKRTIPKVTKIRKRSKRTDNEDVNMANNTLISNLSEVDENKVASICDPESKMDDDHQDDITPNVTKSRKRSKRTHNEDVNVANNTMISNLSGVDENKVASICDPESKMDDHQNDSRSKAEAEANNLFQQSNPMQAYRNGGEHHGQQSRSSEEEDDDEPKLTSYREHEGSARSYTSQATVNARIENVVSQRDAHVRPHFHTLDDRTWQGSNEQQHLIQKSPQLGRRPLSNNQDNVHRRYEQKQIPESTIVTRSSAPVVECKTNWSNLQICIPIALTLLLCYLVLTWIMAPPAPADQSFEQVLKKFEEKPESFLSKFPSQNPDNWRKIRSTVKATTAFTLPRSPGVIAIVSLAASEPVANCMGRKLANELRVAYNDSEFVSLRGKDYEGKDADDVKMEVDRWVRHGLENGMHVVLLEGLHHLPAKSGLLFNGLCDNDNAPFKQAIYIFTCVTDKIVAGTDQQVTTFWKAGLPEDQRHSLETRIGNNIVVVNPEKNDSFYKECA